VLEIWFFFRARDLEFGILSMPAAQFVVHSSGLHVWPAGNASHGPPLRDKPTLAIDTQR
jgi:hypothetical protein